MNKFVPLFHPRTRLKSFPGPLGTMNGSVHPSTAAVEIKLKRGPAGKERGSVSSGAKWLRSSKDQHSWSFLERNTALNMTAETILCCRDGRNLNKEAL